MGARIDSFLRLVVEQKASDLHFHAGSVPLVRHDGELIPLPFRSLSPDETRKFLFEIMSPAERTTFEQTQELDFAYPVDGLGRFRANVFMQSRGMGAVFRIIPSKIPSIDELGVPRVLKKLAALQNGLVLVSGPTGSGKTTTLAAIIHEINRTAQRHIITIEDPIEYVHQPLRSVLTQRQVGLHTESFASALRSALRESPDVVVIGELRDMETVTLALSAAETGVLVFGTLHTNSAAKSIDRLIDVCPEEMHAQVRVTLSTLLRGVVAQQLVKRSSGEGMVVAAEVLLPSVALSHMIREGKGHQVDAYIQSSEGDGSSGSEMQSLDMTLCRLVRQGVVDVDDAISVAAAPDLVRRAAANLDE
ncbi:MAG: PilT/PilU family type 4a pilus ATPase [Polyangiaceae bacterium]|nr:PilT/PilU family type 4a pilus ATPase [Polyangiaceae bacterium]